MKKRFLTSVLALATCVFGAFGFAACDDDENSSSNVESSISVESSLSEESSTSVEQSVDSSITSVESSAIVDSSIANEESSASVDDSTESSVSVDSSTTSVESTTSEENSTESIDSLTSVEDSTSDEGNSSAVDSESSPESSSAVVVDAISFNTLSVDGTTVYGKVSNSTTEFSFVDEVSVSGAAKFVVALDPYGVQTIVMKTIPLTIGDNKVYVFEMIDDEVATVYEVTVRRRPTYEVSFETNGGTAVASQTVEEDSLLVSPVTTKVGYDFAAWDYDFSAPIVADTHVTASWNIIHYSVTYDLDGGSLGDSVNPESYTIETPTISLATPTRVNYGFLGWYNGEEKVESIEEGSHTPLQLTAKWEYALIISGDTLTGVTDSAKATCREVIIPENITAIADRVFFDCDGLTIIHIADIAAWCNISFSSYEANPLYYGKKLYVNNELVTDLVIPETITEIKAYAFYNDQDLTSISLSGSVSAIGEDAFYGCEGLTRVDITDIAAWCSISFGNYAANPLCYAKNLYLDNELVTDLVIPEGVTLIGYSAFADCTSLTSVVIPDSVTSIGAGAFWACTSLTSVVIPDSIESIGNGAFENCPITTAILPTMAISFIPKAKLQKVVVTSGDAIGSGAFASSSGLTEITLPFVGATKDGTSNTHFGYIFGASRYSDNDDYVPSSLKKVTVTGGTIGDYAFYGCISLTSITIGDNVTAIGYEAFYSCSSLTNIVVGENNTAYKSIDGNLYSKDGTILIQYAIGKSATAFVIPDGVISISDTAFYNCSKLTSIEIPNSVTSIGERVFANCTSLVSVVIPDSVTKMGRGAFASCSSLTEITLPFVGATKDGASDMYLGYIFGLGDYTNHRAGIPSSLKKVAVAGGAIGDYAFYACTSLTSVEIGDGVTSIGYNAFYSCNNSIFNKYGNCQYLGNEANPYLALIQGTSGSDNYTVHESTKMIADYAFYNCSNLASIEIADNVMSIGRRAFYGCANLASITIGNSVASIGREAFYNCSSLKNVYITDIAAWCNILGIDNLMSYGAGNKNLYVNDELAAELVIPDTVTEIKTCAFCGFSNLTSVIIPDSVTSIGNEAFYGCSSLKKVYITDIAAWCNISGIDNLMSYGAGDKNLYVNDELVAELVIPDTVTEIKACAFRGFSNLTSITIPDSVTLIDAYVFSGCSGLTSITVDENNTAYKSIDGNLYSKDGTILMQYAVGKSTAIFVVSDSVTSIGYGAFEGCANLTEITLPFVGATKDGTTNTHFGYIFGASKYSDNDNYVPSSLKKVTVTGGALDSQAFYGCSSLTSVLLPDSVTAIGNATFYGCTSLTSVSIPDSVQTIGDTAFYNCASLTSIVIPDSVTSIGNYAFYKCNSLTEMTLPLVGNTTGNYSTFGYIFGYEEYSYKEYLSSSLTYYHYYDSYANKYYCYYIPDSLTNVTITSGAVNAYAFYYCVNLTSVVIADGVTVIRDYAFSNCFSLTSIVISDTVSGIGKQPFKGCDRLTIYCESASMLSNLGDTHPVVLDCNNNDVASDGYIYTVVDGVRYALKDGEATIVRQSRNITTANIPTSLMYKGVKYNVTTISNEAFYDCDSLTSVKIGNGVTAIGDYAFKNCNKLTGVEIGNSVTSIGYEAFYRCTSLKSVVIPDSVKTIDDYAFSNCTSLRNVTIGNGVTLIDDKAFSDCPELTRVIIGKGVKEIGGWAFSNCNNLKEIYYRGAKNAWWDIKIPIEVNGDNKLSSVEKYFYVENEADVPTDGGNYWHYDGRGNIAIW